MQSLRDKVSIRKVKEAIAQLPRGSGSAASKIAYDETMNRIRGQEKGFCDLAIATLTWVSSAMRPLTLRELQCALSIEPGDSAMDEADFVDEETLSSVCAGLVVVDRQSQIVRLAHYTTQEYFDSQKDVLFSDGQKLLATTCLTYLSFDMFSNWQLETFGPYSCRSQSPDSLAVRGERETYYHYYPLLSYAASHWHEHAHFSQDPTIQRLIMDYLNRTDKLAALFCFGDPHDANIWSLPESFPTQSIHGLLVAARYGLTDAVKALLRLEGYCTQEESRIKAQALNLAVTTRQSSVILILLDGNTIAPAAVSHALNILYTLPLAALIAAPVEAPALYEVTEILLNHGAEPNIAVGDIPLIHLASDRNDVKLASLLLSHGADVELRDEYGRSSLHRVAVIGHSGDIVKVLLENRVDINARNNRGETALLTAVRRCPPGEPENYKSLITQLLGWGASVNQSDKSGSTALHLAASRGALEIACQLLEAGANVNAPDQDGVTPADKLTLWKWGSITEERRAECEEMLARYSFYGCEEKNYAYNGGDDLY